MKRLLSTICLIILITSVGIQSANAVVKFYGATSISDPSTGLDEIAGPGLGDGDLGLLILPATQDFCVYVLDDDADETTSAETPCPQYIQPITTPGTKTWVLTASAATSIDFIDIDNPYYEFGIGTASESEWWMGPNHDAGGDDNDVFEFRQSATPGTNLRMSIDVDGTLNLTTADDPLIYYDPATASESEWWTGANHDGVGDDNDPFEIRQSATPGTSVMMSLEPVTGNVAFTGDLTGTTLSRILTTAEGVHDTGAAAATLLDSGESFPTDQYIGMTLYNVTAGESCVVTDNDGTTMTCTLSGAETWDVDDVWAVAPGPSQSGAIWYIGAATTILHPATAHYTAMYYSTGANLVKVDPQSDSMQITLNGTATGTNGEELDSESAAGDFICIQNQSATVGVTLGRSGAWTDGGDS